MIKDKNPDIVEVIRCKDCKHWAGVLYGYECLHLSTTDHVIRVSPEAYCSSGSRKYRGGDVE